MTPTHRIAVISENLAEPWDEGIKRFAFSIGTSMKRHGEVLLVNVDRDGTAGTAAVRVPPSRTFASRALAARLRAHDPGVVLYVPSPSNTLASFLRSRMLRHAAPRARIGMVALIPRRHPKHLGPLLRATAPDMIWVGSYRSLLHLSRARLTGGVLPVGVDPTVFRPAHDGEKAELRRKHRINADAFVVLHVGHIRPKRNLEMLVPLCDVTGVEVVLVGSTSTPLDDGLRERLQARGVRVVRELVPVEEFYRMADCYAFPVVDEEGCVEMPLSVVEAMASGLPVVATPFGGLRDFFREGEDFVYWERSADLAEAVERFRTQKPRVRAMDDFAWDRLADRVWDILVGSAPG